MVWVIAIVAASAAAAATNYYDDDDDDGDNYPTPPIEIPLSRLSLASFVCSPSFPSWARIASLCPSSFTTVL